MHRGEVSPVASGIPSENRELGNGCMGTHKEIWQDVSLRSLSFSVLEKGLSREEQRFAWYRFHRQLGLREHPFEFLDACKRYGDLGVDHGIDPQLVSSIGSL